MVTDMYWEERSDTHVKEALEAELACLLGEYVRHRRTLTSWDCHCLRQAIDFVEAGRCAQALERVTQISRPPVPLPVFPVPQALTLADICRALSLISLSQGKRWLDCESCLTSVDRRARRKLALS
jgi:hypothetical protein